jgi:hypothetical protein
MRSRFSLVSKRTTVLPQKSRFIAHTSAGALRSPAPTNGFACSDSSRVTPQIGHRDSSTTGYS